MAQKLSIAKKLRPSLQLGKRYMLRMLWTFFAGKFSRIFHVRRRNHRIILFAHSQVMVTHLILYVQALKQVRKDIEFYIHLMIKNKAYDEQALRCHAAGIRAIPQWQVPLMQFDLCVVADHSYPQEVLADSIPVLFIYHALTSSDILDGENYKYGRSRVYDQFGRLKYDCMFEASFRQAETAIAHNPEFRSLIKVVGNPQVDEFLGLCSHRESLRGKYGYSEDEVVVMLQSTWGGNSLDQVYGEKLFSLCQEVSRRTAFRFILSTHPNHWGQRLREDRSSYYLGLENDRFKVLRPSDRREEYLAISDICISDTTSLSFLYAFSGRALIFVETPSDVTDQNSELACLMRLCPQLNLTDDLVEQLDELPKCFPYSAVLELVNSYCNYQGRYAERCAEETMKLLPLRKAKKRL